MLQTGMVVVNQHQNGKNSVDPDETVHYLDPYCL